MVRKSEVVLELAIQKHIERINYTKAKHLRGDIDATVKEIRTHLDDLERDGAIKKEHGEWRILL